MHLREGRVAELVHARREAAPGAGVVAGEGRRARDEEPRRGEADDARLREVRPREVLRGGEERLPIHPD